MAQRWVGWIAKWPVGGRGAIDFAAAAAAVAEGAAARDLGGAAAAAASFLPLPLHFNPLVGFGLSREHWVQRASPSCQRTQEEWPRQPTAPPDPRRRPAHARWRQLPTGSVRCGLGECPAPSSSKARLPRCSSDPHGQLGLNAARATPVLQRSLAGGAPIAIQLRRRAHRRRHGRRRRTQRASAARAAPLLPELGTLAPGWSG